MYEIKFDPANHTYRRVSDGILYLPVTTFTRFFCADFAGEHHSKKKAAVKCLGQKKFDELKDAWHADKNRHILMPEFIPYLEGHIKHWESYEQEQLRVLEVWREKRDSGASKGTRTHDWHEQAALMRGYEINEVDGEKYPVRKHGKEEDGSNTNIVSCLADLEWGFYPELMIWYDFPEPVFSEKYGDWVCGICGQSDRVFINEEKTAYVSDYKTDKDKKLDNFGIRYRNYGKNGEYAFQMMLWPFHERREHAVNKYSFQLNTYAWMLEKHGLNIGDITILHKDDKIPVYYEPELVRLSTNMAFSTGL